ncbi:uncharacterized protein LOC126836617 isoform X2 [Adelges cooleyi]|uniref:uncharacterized protein LOC126836617 isoform X2 n=1 Tax=Adelges cooleyi TaxID=133065 RepID=UPI00217F3C52|nr:uncharacterized protein LOC126836617 isoform X2 [Adelges cooleyi]
MKTATFKRYVVLAVMMASLVVGKETADSVKPESPKLTRPDLFYQNNTIIMVTWPKPATPLDYQLDVIVQYGVTVHDLMANTALFFSLINHGTQTFSFNLDRNYHYVRVADCYNKYNNVEQTSFMVRAVINRDDPNKPLYGPWSPSSEVTCAILDHMLVFIMRTTAWLFVLVCVTYFMLFGIRVYNLFRLWHKYRAMSDVQIVLPRADTGGKKPKTGPGRLEYGPAGLEANGYDYRCVVHNVYIN